MKKLLAIVVIFVFFLIVLGLILFKLLGPSQKKEQATPATNPFAGAVSASNGITNETPEQAVRTCYTWYLQVASQRATIQEIASRPEARSCFTPTFVSSWENYAASTDIEPVLLAQDIGTTWSNNISVTTTGQSIHATDLEVRLGTAEDMHIVDVHTVQDENGAWKIDSVTPRQ